MFRNMAASMLRTARFDEKAVGAPKVKDRVITTITKAKQLRPFIEKLITLAKHAAPHQASAGEFATQHPHHTAEWKAWRKSDAWQKWNQATAPHVALRRRAFALLRDKEAVKILFEVIGPRFADRNGGYTRIVRLPKPRLGDAGTRAFIEFVGDPTHDRSKKRRAAPAVVASAAAPN